MAVLNLEEERERLQSLIDDPDQFGPFGGRLSAQMKLVQVLEQLEQAREALFHMITFGDREWAIQKAKQALKQQEAGDDH